MTVADPLELEARVGDSPTTYRFRTADGLHASEEFRDETLCLLETLWEEQLGKFLVAQANYGVLGTILAPRAEQVHLTETSARGARYCRQNARHNGVDATVSLLRSPAQIDAQFDTACYAPRGYTPTSVAKQRIVETLARVRPGGRLFLAGRAQTGIGRYQNCVERFCRVQERETRGDCRVIEAIRPETIDPPTFVEPEQFEVTVDGVDLSLCSVPGLFSPGELDHGTRHLLETATVEDGERVLDLACGYGPVGAYAASVADCSVVCTDDSVRATACARRSLSATARARGTLDTNGLDGRVVTADCARGVEDAFDRVLCNPPTHAGSGVLTDMFDRAAELLVEGGELSVVHHSNLNLDEHLRPVGTVLDRTDGQEHTVLTVRRTGVCG